MSPDSSKHTVDIAIIGGGISGLVCAITLARHGIPAHVYEAKSKIGDVGAGVGIGPIALQILKELGVLEDVIKKCGDAAPAMLPFTCVSGLGDHDLIYKYPPLSGQVSAALPRAVFVEALATHVDPQYIHYDKKCVHVTPTDVTSPRSTVKFSDGSSITADVVLVANGIKGSGRDAVTGKPSKENMVYSNTICYRGLVSSAHAKAAGVKMLFNQERPVCFSGPDKHIISYTIKGGELINIAAFVMDRTVEFGSITLPPDHPTVTPVSVGEVLKTYEGWGPEITALLSCLTHPNKWFINVVYPPLESYAKGKVALLGDAAHGMLPHLGSGAGQCIEDAYLVTELLAHPETTVHNVEDILQVYDEIRRPRAQKVWEGSLRQGDNFEGYGEHGPSAEGMVQDLTGMYDITWQHSFQDDLDKAVARLRELGAFSRS